MAIRFSLDNAAVVPPIVEAAEIIDHGHRDSSDVLRLAVAQMHCALEEGHPQVDTLSQTITLMHEAVNQLRDLVPQATGNGVLATHEMLAQQLGQAVLAVQFYDRLAQRMGHVRHSLELLEQTLSSEDQSSQHWHRMLDAIRATYTMEDEKRVFEIVMQGGNAADAAAAPPPPNAAADDNSIELF